VRQRPPQPGDSTHPAPSAALPDLIPGPLAELLAGRLRVTGDPTRIRMPDRLRRGPAGVQEDLADAAGRSQQNVSQHLTRLIERGFVACGRHGSEHHCRLIDPSPVQVPSLVSADLTGQLRRPADMTGHDTAAPGK
jgi:Helix-turn-helix domain